MQAISIKQRVHRRDRNVAHDAQLAICYSLEISLPVINFRRESSGPSFRFIPGGFLLLPGCFKVIFLAPFQEGYSIDSECSGCFRAGFIHAADSGYGGSIGRTHFIKPNFRDAMVLLKPFI